MAALQTTLDFDRPASLAADAPRLNRHCTEILAALKSGPKTNAELTSICLRYGARIFDLRKLGHRIDKESLGGGLWLYTLSH